VFSRHCAGVHGGFYDGDFDAYETSFSCGRAAISRLLGYTRQNVQLPYGDFHTDLCRESELRFTTLASVRALQLQQPVVAGSSNIRIALLIAADGAVCRLLTMRDTTVQPYDSWDIVYRKYTRLFDF